MYERFNSYSTTRPRLRKTVGWVFVVVGIAGIVAPVLPGAPLVYVGLELIGLRIVFTDKVRKILGKRDTKEPLIRNDAPEGQPLFSEPAQ